MSPKQTLAVLVLMILMVIGSNSFFVVNEWQKGLLLHFGKIQKVENTEVAVVRDPGLHFKWPFIDKVIYVDTKLQTMDGRPQEVMTNEKKALVVDTYVKWIVADYAQFYIRTQNDNSRAENLLERIVNTNLRAEVGKNTVKETISGERAQMMVNIRARSNESAPELGVKIIDVRVKQVNYPVAISDTVYERMRSERHRVATAFRSNGKKEAAIIEAGANRKATVIQANADRDAKIIVGKADAEAANIYALAYNKDADFFGFVRSLEAYDKSFNNNQDLMVIKPDSEFFQFMKDAKGDKKK
ncbi:MAG: protease modulator HflC [Gammaproteobacteria bacterium]|nr:MAG: protease modulator HflC [Gammaproteobacteria bacterium]